MSACPIHQNPRVRGWRSEDHREISPASTALPCTAKIAENLWHPNCRITSMTLALKDIADAMGDVDAFIAQYDLKTRKVPQIAAEIATRLLAAGRAGDALRFVERAEITEGRWIPREWQDARLDALEGLGRVDEAQAFRWECFERDLSLDHLRAYLKRLPDFEDIEAEERAMDHAVKNHRLTPEASFRGM